MRNSRTPEFCRIIFVVGLGLWAGASSFFSFAVAPLVFSFLRDQLPQQTLPGVSGLTFDVGRRLAGDTVGAIFPVYFGVQIVVGAGAVLAGFVARRAGQSNRVAPWLTAAALAVTTTHALTVYPWSIAILDQHYRAESAVDSSQATRLRREFGMWHGVSQTLNLSTIVLVLGAFVSATTTRTHRTEAVTGERASAET